MRKGIRPSQHFFSFFEKHETNRNIGSSSSVLSRSAAPRSSLPFLFVRFFFSLKLYFPILYGVPQSKEFFPRQLTQLPIVAFKPLPEHPSLFYTGIGMLRPYAAHRYRIHTQTGRDTREDATRRSKGPLSHPPPTKRTIRVNAWTDKAEPRLLKRNGKIKRNENKKGHTSR